MGNLFGLLIFGLCLFWIIYQALSVVQTIERLGLRLKNDWLAEYQLRQCAGYWAGVLNLKEIGMDEPLERWREMAEASDIPPDCLDSKLHEGFRLYEQEQEDQPNWFYHLQRRP